MHTNSICVFICLLAVIVTAEDAMTLESPPSIIFEGPQYMIFKTDGKVQIPCKATGNPAPSYTWYFNNKELSKATMPNAEVSADDGGTLVIKSPLRVNEGYYQCSAKNKYGAALSNVTFLVAARLSSFSPMPVEKYTVNEGSSLRMICEKGFSIPPATVKWEQDDEAGSTRKHVHLDQRISTDEHGNLLFAHVKKTDKTSAGISYKCCLTNTFLEIDVCGSRSELKVNTASPVNLAPSLMESSGDSKTGLLGEEVRLYCFFSGFPTPAIIWEREGGNLTSQRHLVEPDGTMLVIQRPQEDDNGTFVCKASNGVGEKAHHQIQLKIESKPNFWSEPTDVNVTKGDSITVECKAKGSPKPEIEWFKNMDRLNAKKLDSGLKLSADASELTIKSADTSMVLHCNASNRHGYVFGRGYVHVSGAVPVVVRVGSAYIIMIFLSQILIATLT